MQLERNVLKKLAYLLAVVLVPVVLTAQNPEAAVGAGASMSAGVGFSTFNPDYACTSSSPFQCNYQLLGPTVWYDFNLHPKWGVEGEARWLNWHGYGSQEESNYLGGGRYRIWRHGRFDAWGKTLIGGGWITTPYYPRAGSLKGSYFAIVPGATAEYRLTHRLSLRGDYEYEFWPSFAGPPTYNAQGQLVEHNSGLTPNGFTVGVMYRFLGH